MAGDPRDIWGRPSDGGKRPASDAAAIRPQPRSSVWGRTTTADGASGDVARVVYADDPAAFRALALRGNALMIPTLGLYRFWYGADLRRHWWRSTSAGGDALEYVGTGREALIGFLVAIAILAPAYLAFFLVTVELERALAFAGLATLVFSFLFAQFATFKARRYRLSRTLFKGLRFSMEGSAWGYALHAGLWTLATILTLGLAYPWRQAALERRLMAATSYGDLPGRFEGRAGDFFRQGLWLWLAAVAGPLVIAALAAIGVIALSGIVAIVWFIALPFLFATFRAVELRWRWSGARLGPIVFASDLDRGAMIGVYLRYAGALLFIGLAASAAFGALLALVGDPIGRAGGEPKLAALVGYALVYLAAIVAIGVATDMILRRGVWMRVARSLSVANLAAAGEAIARAGATPSGTGEGLADAFDLGGF